MAFKDECGGDVVSERLRHRIQDGSLRGLRHSAVPREFTDIRDDSRSRQVPEMHGGETELWRMRLGWPLEVARNMHIHDHKNIIGNATVSETFPAKTDNKKRKSLGLGAGWRRFRTRVVYPCALLLAVSLPPVMDNQLPVLSNTLKAHGIDPQNIGFAGMTIAATILINESIHIFELRRMRRLENELHDMQTEMRKSKRD